MYLPIGLVVDDFRHIDPQPHPRTSRILPTTVLTMSRIDNYKGAYWSWDEPSKGSLFHSVSRPIQKGEAGHLCPPRVSGPQVGGDHPQDLGTIKVPRKRAKLPTVDTSPNCLSFMAGLDGG